MQDTYDIILCKPEGIRQYMPYIYSKWLRSLRFGNDYFKIIDSKIYYQTYQMYLNYLMQEEDFYFRIARLSDDHDVLLGFSAFHGNKLHFVYVHKDFRKAGIGTSLLPDKKIDFITHVTKTGITIWKNNYKDKWRFNPF